jgi:hypothetical protein
MRGDEASSGAPQTGPGIGRSASLGKLSDTNRAKQGDSLREIKIRDYICGLIVTIVGLGLYSYYVRELMAALTLFSVAFFFLALAGLSGLLVWSASVQLAIWARPASRNMIAFSRRLVAAYAKP